jgi:colanic acid/amylovoran biosynthesis glycosyltransferase
LVGFKTQKDIKNLLEVNNVFLMSSITDTHNRAEAQGVVTAEAQAMGLPVVAFDSGGVSHTILSNETGFLVEEKKIEDYADAIIQLLDKPSLYKMMSQNARDFAKNRFSSDLMAIEFFKLYD